MTAQLIIEAGAAETRSALLVDGRVKRFFFSPARGDEAVPREAEAGDIILARTKSHAAGGAFLDIGDAREAYLPTENLKLPSVGSAVIVRITRPALREKGALAALNLRQSVKVGRECIEAKAATLKPPARLNADIDAALHALQSLSLRDVAKVVASDPETARHASVFAGAQIDVAINADAWEQFACDEALEASLARSVPLASGGRLIFDEAAALTAIDIDCGPVGRDARASFSAEAAEVVFREIARRSIGGQIIVDFPAPSGSGDRAALSALLTRLQREAVGGRPGRLNNDGLYQLVVPRTEKSLLERASRVYGNGWLRPGRVFNHQWLSVEAVRALERVLRRAPNGRPRLLATRDVFSYLEERPAWLDRVRRRYGARFEVQRCGVDPADVADQGGTGGFEIVE